VLSLSPACLPCLPCLPCLLPACLPACPPNRRTDGLPDLCQRRRGACACDENLAVCVCVYVHVSTHLTAPHPIPPRSATPSSATNENGRTASQTASQRRSRCSSTRSCPTVRSCLTLGTALRMMCCGRGSRHTLLTGGTGGWRYSCYSLPSVLLNMRVLCFAVLWSGLSSHFIDWRYRWVDF
jgi:hypothetical protein